MTDPNQSATEPSEGKTATRWLPILICNRGIASIPFPMTEDDYGLMMATLKLWKPRLVLKVSVDGPFIPSLPLLIQ